MKKAFKDLLQTFIFPFLNDIALPFLGFSAIGIAAVFSVVFVIRLMWVVGEFAWTLI